MCVPNVPVSKVQQIVKMEDVFGAQAHALVVIPKQAKAPALLPTTTVDGPQPIANATNVHITQRKLYVLEQLVVRGAPPHAFLVPLSQHKQLAYLQAVIGVFLGCATFAQVIVPPQHVQRHSLALGILILTPVLNVHL